MPLNFNADGDNKSNTPSTGGIFGSAGPAPAAAGGLAFGNPGGPAPAAAGGFGGFSFDTSTSSNTSGGAPPSAFGGASNTTTGSAPVFDNGGTSAAPPSAGDSSKAPAPPPAAGGNLFGNSFGSSTPAASAGTAGDKKATPAFGAPAPAGDANKATPAPFTSPAFGGDKTAPAASTFTGKFGAAPVAGGNPKDGSAVTASTFQGFGVAPNPGGDKNDAAPAPAFSGGFGTAAPASGDMSGGSAPAAPAFHYAAATGDKKDAPPAAASAAAGFSGLNSFGAATPGAGDKNPPSTPGGFPPQTPKTPAPVNTPGAPAAAPTPGTAGASTTAAPAPTATSTYREPTPLDVKSQSVEQILNLFQKSQEQDALIHMEEARRVANFDAILRDALRDINNLAEQTHRCAQQQEEIEQTLSGIGEMEKQLDSTLEQLEQQVDELFDATSTQSPLDADQQREQAYNAAMHLENRLVSLTDSLQQTLKRMDEAQARVWETDPQVGPIVRVLHEHQNALRDLEKAGQTIEAEMAQVSQFLAQK